VLPPLSGMKMEQDVCSEIWGMFSRLLKANSHLPCHARAVPLSWPDALIHIYHAVSFVKVRVVAGNIRTASPTILRIDMLLITNFVDLRVVAGRRRKRAGCLHAVFGRPMLIHTCHARLCHAHAALCRDLEKSLSERDGRGMTRARNGHVTINQGHTL
jgi:hypothetical protein